jgi:hypothetical protein
VHPLGGLRHAGGGVAFDRPRARQLALGFAAAPPATAGLAFECLAALGGAGSGALGSDQVRLGVSDLAQ